MSLTRSLPIDLIYIASDVVLVTGHARKFDCSEGQSMEANCGGSSGLLPYPKKVFKFKSKYWFLNGPKFPLFSKRQKLEDEWFTCHFRQARRATAETQRRAYGQLRLQQRGEEYGGVDCVDPAWQKWLADVGVHCIPNNPRICMCQRILNTIQEAKLSWAALLN